VEPLTNRPRQAAGTDRHARHVYLGLDGEDEALPDDEDDSDDYALLDDDAADDDYDEDPELPSERFYRPTRL
jgi:hypothetical protein